jgi:phosphatidylinositol glycan class V
MFCTADAPDRPPWCAARLPSVYTYVQAKYWNSGFLLYWTPAQAPNIALALPLLALLLSFSLHHAHRVFLPLLLSLRSRSSPAPPESRDPFLARALTPYTLHAAALSAVLLAASNTQITLRLASALPPTYWAAARLLVARPALGRAWVVGGAAWAAASVVLWTTFLPPA